MKSKDLIKELQKYPEDQEVVFRGETGWEPVSYVNSLEGYWDGPYQYRDQNGIFTLTTENSKLCLYSRSWKDEIESDPDAQINIEYTYINPDSKNNMLKEIEKYREEIKDLYNKMNIMCIGWVLDKMKEGYTVIKFNDRWRYIQYNFEILLLYFGISTGETLNSGSIQAIQENSDIFEIQKTIYGEKVIWNKTTQFNTRFN